MSFKYSFSKFCAEGAAKKSNKSPLPKNTHILASSALKVLLRSQKDQKFKKTPKFSQNFPKNSKNVQKNFGYPKKFGNFWQKIQKIFGYQKNNF